MIEFKLCDFEKWVDQHGDNDIIGIALNPCQCPIANWAKELLSAVDIHVDRTSLMYSVNGEIYKSSELPSWVYSFISHIDTLALYQQVRDVTKLRAQHVIKIEIGDSWKD